MKFEGLDLLNRAANAVANDSAALQCGRDIRHVLTSALTEPWALQMVDATAKLPEPLLGGLAAHLGDFDGCLAARGPRFAGRYCLARAAPLRLGLCVPSSCGERALDRLLGAAAQVPSGACQAADDPRPLHGATVALAVVLLAALLLAGAAAAVGAWGRERSSLRRAAAALSPAAAWRQLSAPARAPAGPLGALAGVRVLSIAWVVLGHRQALMASLPLLDLVQLAPRLLSWDHFFVVGGLFAVDTFLLLAGAVLAFQFLRCPPKTFGAGSLLLFYLHRYIRLTPLLAFVILIYAGGLPVLGDGPMWPELSKFDVNNCLMNWWANLLYIHNYYGNRNMCVGHSWYLAVDMQLYLLSPLLLLPLARRPRVGLALLGAVALASVAVPFAVAWANDIPPVPNPLGDPSDYLAHAENLYIPTHARAAPWLLGVALGALLAASPAPKLRAPAAAALWALAGAGLLGGPLALTAVARATVAPAPGAAPPPAWASALFVAASKPLWAAGVGAVLLLSATGRAGPVGALLCWGPWARLARLTYAVYLLHPLVQGVTGWTVRGTNVSTDIVVWPMVVSDLTISFLLAVPASLLFESPFIALEKLLLSTRGRARTAPAKVVCEGEGEGKAEAEGVLSQSVKAFSPGPPCRSVVIDVQRDAIAAALSANSTSKLEEVR